MGMAIAAQPDLTVHDVRDVAPKKRMLCVSFTMPEPNPAEGTTVGVEGAREEGPPAKRAKSGESPG